MNDICFSLSGFTLYEGITMGECAVGFLCVLAFKQGQGWLDGGPLESRTPKFRQPRSSLPPSQGLLCRQAVVWRHLSILFIYIIFDCAGSSLLHVSFL